jgi:putative acetyltransferase
MEATRRLLDWIAINVDLRLDDVDRAAAVQLIAALNAEIRDRYGEPLERFVLDLDPDDVAPGRGAFTLAWVGLEAVGCGAVRLIDANRAELKRMYVVPDYRGHGVAAAILRFLERHARSLGATRMVLETVTTPPAAVALYRGAGYEEIPKFGPYVDSGISFCMGKLLPSD